MLLLDHHKAQKTPSVLTLLKDECNIITVFDPLGCTSLVQPLDVFCNDSFKYAIDELARVTAHFEEISMIICMVILQQVNKESC